MAKVNNRVELKILIGMHRNVNEIDKKTSKLASEYGLTTSQFAVLEALYSKGDMSVGMVRKHILSSMGTIPLIVDNLVKHDYVERLSDPKDRRVSILHLTPKGYDLIKELAPKNEDNIIDHMKVLSEAEKEQLLYLMKKLGGRLEQETILLKKSK